MCIFNLYIFISIKHVCIHDAHLVCLHVNKRVKLLICAIYVKISPAERPILPRRMPPSDNCVFILRIVKKNYITAFLEKSSLLAKSLLLHITCPVHMVDGAWHYAARLGRVVLAFQGSCTLNVDITRVVLPTIWAVVICWRRAGSTARRYSIFSFHHSPCTISCRHTTRGKPHSVGDCHGDEYLCWPVYAQVTND